MPSKCRKTPRPCSAQTPDVQPDCEMEKVWLRETVLFTLHTD